jgi:hypothetical protein
VRLNRWSNFPPGIKQHLQQCLLERKITLDDLDKLRVWVDSDPDLPQAPGSAILGLSKLSEKVQIHSAF